MDKQVQTPDLSEQKPESNASKKSDRLQNSLLALIGVLAVILFYFAGFKAGTVSTVSAPVKSENQNASALTEQVLPASGVELPVRWGDMGQKLVSLGVLDLEKFENVYQGRGGLSEEAKAWLAGETDGKLTINAGNARHLLNLFWALGLANKSPILDSGEIADPKYGGPQNFASTAGWTLAKGSAMEHYSKHELITLTAEQQALVDKVSRGIYRPCCGNSTHFPDCNHGMAMLGLLELMASQNVSEDEMWKTALAVNAYWFPDTYLTIATYLKSRGIDWQNAKPQEVLGAAYSSAQGYRNIAAQVQPISRPSGGSCGV